MAKSENKTRPTGADVEAYLAGVEPARRREDAHTLLAMMRKITGLEPEMWGPSMIGFGSFHYCYDSGREGDMFMTGFAPRKANMVVYLITGFADHEAKLAQLGKHKTGRACLYINTLADVDIAVLEAIIRDDFEAMKAKYGV